MFPSLLQTVRGKSNVLRVEEEGDREEEKVKSVS